MKGKMIKLLAAVMSAFFIFYAGYQAYRFFYNRYQTDGIIAAATDAIC